ncbi:MULTISPECIES: hypothetical protein [Salimicrobium]|uniref:Uncharacterized protein n=2 Tax=Salimicrobium TaxID=351195 RepID=A0ABY1KU51_9BACI|nr:MULTISPECIES: hypothetical protein [Salimicrobium]SDX84979.1 hypothetical protein SAMN04488081_1478 [Salimicrobium album]SIS79876.1 hypothetical protein SAMN05421758_1067 [Salimicrobium salexigens]
MFVPPYLIIRLTALLVSAGVFRFARTGMEGKKEVFSKGTTLLTTFFLVFFSSKLVTTFPMVLDYPVTVLSYPSGTLEFYIASVAAAIHAFRLKLSKDELYGMTVLLSGSFFFYYIGSIIIMEDNVLHELVIWFIIYAGSLLWKNYWSALFGSVMLAAGAVSLIVPVLDVMGVPVDAGYYFVIAAGVFIMGRGVFKWKRT